MTTTAIAETIVHTVGNLFTDRKYLWRTHREVMARLASVDGNLKRVHFFVILAPEYKIKFEWTDGRTAAFNVLLAVSPAQSTFKSMLEIGFFSAEEMAAIRRVRDATLALVEHHLITDWDVTFTYT